MIATTVLQHSEKHVRRNSVILELLRYTSYVPQKILRKRFLNFLLGGFQLPKEIENNSSAELCRANKVQWGQYKIKVFVREVQAFNFSSG